MMKRHYRRSRHTQMITLAAVVTAILLVAAVVVFNLHSSARPPEPIQAGDSKTNCIYAKLGAPLRQIEQATDINYTCIETFSNVDPTWSDWVRPWVTRDGYGYDVWLAANPAGRQVILTLNVIPGSVAGDPKWTAKCAAGDYNIYATSLARNLVVTGFGYSVIRLGAEMNGTWNAGSLSTTVAGWHQWGQCFAQEVRAMRAVRGNHLLFDWDINADHRNIPLAQFYPGNAYVDIIGIDFYDFSEMSLPPVGNTRRWTALAAEPEGLDQVEAFAATHGKPLSFPEWGTAKWQGDDAKYVTNMGIFIAKHDVAFQSWFDDGNDGILELNRTQAPLSLAAYINAFR